jgi:uncharacterized membrane protein
MAVADDTGRPASAARPRWAALDLARGLAVVAMVLYHFCWDLAYFGLIEANVATGWGWKQAAWSIAASFLAISGVSLALALRGGTAPARPWRRLAVLALAAGAVTLASLWFMPDRFIFFGILHCLAVGGALAMLVGRWPPAVLAALAALWFAVAALVRLPLFDSAPLLFVGLGTTMPLTTDYVPLFPWFGFMLAGLALGGLLAKRGVAHGDARAPAARPLLWLGRHSLPIYLVHQPLLIGAFTAGLWLAGQGWFGSRAGEAGFLDSCRSSCRATGQTAQLCQSFCACAADNLQREGLWGAVLRDQLGPREQQQVNGIIALCQRPERR